MQNVVCMINKFFLDKEKKVESKETKETKEPKEPKEPKEVKGTYLYLLLL